MADYLVLNNGQRIPQVALGTSRISTENMEVTIKRALDIGYRHIDTAYWYESEAAIGKALEEYLETNKLTRQDVFITTKLPTIHMKGSDVGPSLDESLKKLRLEYVDLYLLHFPCATKLVPDTNDKEFTSVDLRETWTAMEDTVYNGKARSIGVCSCNSKQLDYICKTARIPPVVNQVEVQARFPQKKLHEFCKSRNIQLEAFGALGSPAFVKAEDVNGMQSSDTLLRNPVVRDIAEKYKRTAGQILLRNLVQRGIIVIPKSENPQRMKDNLEIFSFSLNEEDMNKLEELDNGVRRFVFPFYKGHPEYPLDDA